MRRKIAYSREGYDGVTRNRRPFGVYEYGVLVRANLPSLCEAQALSVLEMSKEIR